MRLTLAFITLGLMTLMVGPAGASPIHYTARLSGRGEASPVRSPAVGELQAVFDPETRLFAYKLTYQSLSGPATAARFQGPAKPGEVGAPIVTVSDTANPISGNASLTEAQAADLKKGLWYVNISTAANPDGEIRGQLKRVVDWSQAESPTAPTSQFQDVARPPPSLSAR